LRLARGIASVAGRLAFGLQGNVRSGLPSNLGITVSLLSFRGGIAGGLRGGLTGDARQLGQRRMFAASRRVRSRSMHSRPPRQVIGQYIDVIAAKNRKTPTQNSRK